MSDKILYKGQVYGNTVASNLTVVAKEKDPDEIDIDGTELYVIDEGTESEEVEIAGGGRIKYGVGDLTTVICQGLKMTKSLAPLSDNTSDYNYGDLLQKDFFLKNVENGLVKPTDLYTSFNLKTGFVQQPTGNETTFMEDNDIVAFSSDADTIYSGLVAKHPITGIEFEETLVNSFPDSGHNYNRIVTSQYNFSSSCLINPFNNLKAYKDISTVSGGSDSIKTIEETDYAGIYFLVNSVHNGTTYELDTDEKSSTKGQYVIQNDNGYALTTPINVHMSAKRNSFPSIYIPIDATISMGEGSTGVPSSRETCVIRKKEEDNTYTYYYYNEDNKKWAKKENRVAFNSLYSELVLLGTTTDDPSTIGYDDAGRILPITRIEETIDLEEYWSGFFAYEISNGFIAIDNTYIAYSIKWKSSGQSLELSYPWYIETIGNDYIFYVYTKAKPLIDYYNSTQSRYYFFGMSYPFKNEAEHNFALGIREDLSYITKEEYDERTKPTQGS